MAVRRAEASPIALAASVVLAAHEAVGDRKTKRFAAPDAVAQPIHLVAHLEAGVLDVCWMVKMFYALAGGGIRNVSQVRVGLSMALSNEMLKEQEVDRRKAET